MLFTIGKRAMKSSPRAANLDLPLFLNEVIQVRKLRIVVKYEGASSEINAELSGSLMDDTLFLVILVDHLLLRLQRRLCSFTSNTIFVR